MQDPTTHKYDHQDAQGNVVIKLIYDEIEEFDGTDMIVAKSGLYGVIDRDDKVTIDMVYDDIIRQDSHYIVKKQGL
ncbi:WG repeat-containing protein [Moraxella bovoculi]|uniref:WG repeat-containing protein n=1 Tax=Moraxella bovoculi TaxID=386891 RepID=UPI003F5062A1